jgi:hypothetical protein
MINAQSQVVNVIYNKIGLNGEETAGRRGGPKLKKNQFGK